MYIAPGPSTKASMTKEGGRSSVEYPGLPPTASSRPAASARSVDGPDDGPPGPASHSVTFTASTCADAAGPMARESDRSANAPGPHDESESVKRNATARAEDA